MIEKHLVNAIIEDDLHRIIENLQLANKINNGEIKCCNCNKPISISNISLINIIDGDIQFVCDSILCNSINESN